MRNFVAAFFVVVLVVMIGITTAATLQRGIFVALD